MDETEQGVLPYRTDARDLARWVEALARGRSREQIREAGFSAKGSEGTAVAAGVLGLYDPAVGVLTARGRAYALASGEARARMLEAALEGFAPYAGLLAAVRVRGEAVTDAQWVETWWATHGYGGSPSNRAEGVAVLGKLVEALGLARYVPGRRGHATRLEWVEGALGEGRGAAPPAVPAETPRPGRVAVPLPARAGPAAFGEISLDLGEWGVASLRIPTHLPAAEKRRLISLLEVLIHEVP